MVTTLESFTQEIGMSLGLFAVIIAWTGFWKLVGMWHSARDKKPIWFVAIGIFNTLGILPILYLFIFKNLKKEKTPQPKENTKKKKTSKKTDNKITKKKSTRKKLVKKKSTSNKK